VCVGTGEGGALFLHKWRGGGGEQVRLPSASVAAAVPVLPSDPSPWPVGAANGGSYLSVGREVS
jgi:hypothetical protein